jgi:ABC-type glycerol-3-phosphate transport system substrate-binding protein
MKKLFILMLVFVFAASMLLVGVGCKKEAKPAEEEAVEEEAVEEKEVAAEEEVAEEEEEEVIDLGPITYFNYDPGTEAFYVPMFEAFKEKTGIDVEISVVGDPETYIAQLKSSMTTDESPDVFKWPNGSPFFELAEEGLINDLTDLYGEVKDSYRTEVLENFIYEGKIYGAPLWMGFSYMFYNKHVFEKYNLEEPGTWDEFITVCQTLKDNGVTPMADTQVSGFASRWLQQILGTSWPDVYYDVLKCKKSWQAEEVIETFEVWKDMIDKGYFSDPGIDINTEVIQEFAKGADASIAMINIPDWYNIYLFSAGLAPGADYSVFAVPTYLADMPKTVCYSVAPIVISEKSQHKQAARKFIEFWLSDECQTILQSNVPIISPNMSVSGDTLDAVRQKIVSEAYNLDTKIVLELGDVIYSSDVMEQVQITCANFMLDTSTYLQGIANIDSACFEATTEE